MTAALALLAQAQRVMAGSSPHRNRMACWLARSALEEIVRDRLREKGLEPDRGSMRSLLTCLEIAYADEPSVAETAEYAWAGLSNACHQHAFELTPTSSETTALIHAVLTAQGDTG